MCLTCGFLTRIKLGATLRQLKLSRTPEDGAGHAMPAIDPRPAELTLGLRPTDTSSVGSAADMLGRCRSSK